MRSSILSYAREKAMNSIDRLGDRVIDKLDEGMYRIERRVKRTEEVIGGIMAFYFLLVLGIIFLSMALYYLLREYLLYSRALSFLIIGIIVLVIGLLIRIKFTGGTNGKSRYEPDERW